mmetsp:Transcript_30361/g.72404  ORF Transcript_30361/g.72404 Transcript_30361/m.72404 type:complete len:259 (-) Transcript_30361:79-855(-)
MPLYQAKAGACLRCRALGAPGEDPTTGPEEDGGGGAAIPLFAAIGHWDREARRAWPLPRFKGQDGGRVLLPLCERELHRARRLFFGCLRCHQGVVELQERLHDGHLHTLHGSQTRRPNSVQAKPRGGRGMRQPSSVVQLVQLVRISRDVYWRSPWRGSRYDGMEHLQGIGQCKLLPVHQQAPPDDQPANSATHASGCASHVVGQLEPWRLDRGGDQLLWDQRCSGGVPLPERHVRCPWGYEHRPQRGSAHGHQGPPPR